MLNETKGTGTYMTTVAIVILNPVILMHKLIHRKQLIVCRGVTLLHHHALSVGLDGLLKYISSTCSKFEHADSAVQLLLTL
jgi:hypothetical protein